MFFRKLITHSPFISQFFLPNVCILCSYPTHSSNLICVLCEKDLPSLPDHCPRCAQFLPKHCHTLKLICGNCLQKPPPFTQTFALFPYENPIISLITQLKFQHQLSHAQAFSHLFIKKIRHDWYANKPLPDVLIPIPLHTKRMKERGFNQAVEIAKPIAKALRIPLDKTGITRIKETTAQSGLPSSARKQNISQAFASKRNYSGLTIAVLDDVITTGSTIREFCRVLKSSGAQEIHVWCCARRG